MNKQKAFDDLNRRYVYKNHSLLAMLLQRYERKDWETCVNEFLGIYQKDENQITWLYKVQETISFYDPELVKEIENFLKDFLNIACPPLFWGLSDELFD